jgi:hypothetical protein
MIYNGIIIEESLHDKDVLKDVNIVSTLVEKVNAHHETPWLEKWTLHTVEIQENMVENVSEKLARAFDVDHIGNWYADFKNADIHYVIFPNKIFKLDRSKNSDYDEMVEYALGIGLPESQLIKWC